MGHKNFWILVCLLELLLLVWVWINFYWYRYFLCWLRYLSSFIFHSQPNPPARAYSAPHYQDSAFLPTQPSNLTTNDSCYYNYSYYVTPPPYSWCQSDIKPLHHQYSCIQMCKDSLPRTHHSYSISVWVLGHLRQHLWHGSYSGGHRSSPCISTCMSNRR